jgi:hypothetical protein
MAYTNSISLTLGSSKTGLSLRAQLFDTAGTNVGSLVSVGFVEIGQGNYIWTYSGFPDGFRGGVKFYDSTALSIVLAATAVNPEEIETVKNIEDKVNSIEAVIDELTNPPKEITIEVPHITSQGSSVEIIVGNTSQNNPC